MLGGLSRLETLALQCMNVPGVLYPSDFEFLRTASTSRGSGAGSSIEDAVDRKAFCPRLQKLRMDPIPEIKYSLSK